MDQDRTKDWRELCKAAVNEADPAKLMALIAELNKALDAREQKRRRTSREDPDDKDGRARSLQSEPAV